MRQQKRKGKNLRHPQLVRNIMHVTVHRKLMGVVRVSGVREPRLVLVVFPHSPATRKLQRPEKKLENLKLSLFI